LKDVTVDIATGDVVGLLGRNGAGKSTLLKVLSRITEPTRGEAELFGRVGLLLEVGSGFHQELTGRENIFLNGAILGMRLAEVRRQFDAIVDFAGVETFIDTPVKRYSSGMYVRLAFAVAAHLETEILLVDEVLAVGDVEFQRKCLGKMKDLSRTGRTVIFVSHAMHSVALLCNRTAVLDAGALVHYGSVEHGIALYSRAFPATSASRSPDERAGTGEYRYVRVVPERADFHSGHDLIFSYRLERRTGALGKMYLSGGVVDELGVELAQFDSRLTGFWLDDFAEREGTLVMRSPWLKPGRYRLQLYVCTPAAIVDKFDDACTFEVSSVLPYRYSASPDSLAACVVLSDYQWT
jgi:lipopolysaccharide transport system ATP-binding protein